MVLFLLSRNDSAPPTKATFARDVKKPRFFEFVVPPVCGLENLLTNKNLPALKPAVFLIGKRLSCAGRRHLQRVEDLGPEPRNLS